MSSDNPNPTPTDEAEVERAVRAILKPLHQELDLANNYGCSVAGFVLVPLLFVGLWWLDWSWWLALPVAVAAALLLWVLFWTWYDHAAAARAAATFNKAFPPGHPDRELAVRVVAEMEYASLAHEKLHANLR